MDIFASNYERKYLPALPQDETMKHNRMRNSKIYMSDEILAGRL